MFSTLTPKDGGYVTFGDNKKGKIIGIGNIGKTKFSNIENVLLVDGLKHNLLCDDPKIKAVIRIIKHN